MMIEYVDHVVRGISDGIRSLAMPALVFAALALLVKRRQALEAARRALGETRINLTLHFLDQIFVLPLMALVVAGASTLARQLPSTAVLAGLWPGPGVIATLLAAILLGDFIGYWRHRLEHTRFLWPSHAIHHSDTAMTWLTLARFHPINRLSTTLVDGLLLACLGLPAWALLANSLVRHYYGYFIHADLPWTYGRLGCIFVSPAMHRWHHARDIRYAGTNFATVFVFFDRAFGTYYVPGPCDVPLGIENGPARSVFRQLIFPFKQWAGEIGAWLTRRSKAARGV